MNAAQFSRALGKVNDKYIMEAITYKKEKRSGWLKWGAMVACLCLIVSGVFLLKQTTSSPSEQKRDCEKEDKYAILYQNGIGGRKYATLHRYPDRK
mgnify:CR=1 FL=1